MTQPSSEAEQFVLSETTVAEVDDVRVGLSNIWEDSFTDNEGHQRHEVRGTLSVMADNPDDDFDQRVAVGDSILIQGIRYQVIQINEGQQLGSLTLEKRTITTPQPSSDIPWTDLLIFILCIGLPYIMGKGIAQVGLSVLALAIWFAIVKPTWNGLLGFMGTAILLIHAVALSTIALFW